MTPARLRRGEIKVRSARGKVTGLERRPYGKTGESVTVIGRGGACLNQRSHQDGVDAVRRALDVGIT